MNPYYNDFGSWIRKQFPDFRVQKISIDAGFSCPNRDGRISSGGCIYCDNRTFNPSYCDRKKSITEQLVEGKAFFARKYPDMKYLAYFQAYTNTYDTVEHLRRMYEEALTVEDVVGIVIGTRPDCMSDELLDYLVELNKRTFLLVEYGIESANDETLRRINRGHDFACCRDAVERTHARGILTGGHIIIGLPGEDAEESLRQAPIISSLPLDILKIHQMQIIRGTKLAEQYAQHPFHVYTVEEYIDVIVRYIQLLRKDLVLERFVSQSPKELLVAPKWGLKNYEFTNLLNNRLKKNMAKVAIVILNWNGQAMLAKYLPNVIEYSRQDAEVWVADNCSSDQSMRLLETQFPQVKTIVLEQNFGFAEGYNRALKQIEAEYYILLNSDVEVSHHWLTPLIEFMDSHPQVAACQPKLLAEYDKDSFEYAGACGGFLDKYGYPFCRGRIFNMVERDNGQYDYQQEVLWATGACMMIRSKDYWDAGGLDGRFFAHNEEIDLCWRLRLMGRQIYCIPESEVYHVGGGTLPKSNPMKTFLNFRNNLTMLYKNLSDNELKKVMRMRWFLDYLAAFEMLILGRNWGDFKAVFKARKAFKAWRADFDEDRRRIQASRQETEIPQIYQKSILWQYYAKGKKTFKDLM